MNHVVNMHEQGGVMLMSHGLCGANYLFESFDAFMYGSWQTNHCICVTVTQMQTCITAAHRK